MKIKSRPLIVVITFSVILVIIVLYHNMRSSEEVLRANKTNNEEWIEERAYVWVKKDSLETLFNLAKNNSGDNYRGCNIEFHDTICQISSPNIKEFLQSETIESDIYYKSDSSSVQISTNSINMQVKGDSAVKCPVTLMYVLLEDAN